MTYDYSDFKAGPGDNILAQLSGLALDQKKAEAKVARLELELKEAQAELRDISEHKLPAMMAEAEMETFTTKDGIKITIREVIRASIPEANQADAFQWLKDNDHDNLIKREFKIAFNKDEEKWAKKFQADLAKRKKPLKVILKRYVHPQTLAAFIKEMLEKGVNIPLPTFGAFQQKVAKVEVKDKDSKDTPKF